MLRQRKPLPDLLLGGRFDNRIWFYHVWFYQVRCYQVRLREWFRSSISSCSRIVGFRFFVKRPQSCSSVAQINKAMETKAINAENVTG